MSTNGIVVIAEAVHRIVMVLKSDAFTKEEMEKLKKIIETLQRITEKTLAAGAHDDRVRRGRRDERKRNRRGVQSA